MKHRYDNLPDDWDNYYHTCNICGAKYHASEGGCGNCIKCKWCGEYVSPDKANEELEICNECLGCCECAKVDINNKRYYVQWIAGGETLEEAMKIKYTYCEDCKNEYNKPNSFPKRIEEEYKLHEVKE